MVRLALPAAVLATLLFAGVVPGASQVPNPGVRLTASPMATPPRDAQTLDLAAMALNPVDLELVGLSGFGQQSSAMLTPGERAEPEASILGGDPDAVRAALAATGYQRRYERQLGLLARPGARPSRLRTFVAPYVVEYASVEGAAAGFLVLGAELTGVANEDVPGARSFGDQSAVTRFQGSTSSGEPYRALDITFRLGNLVAGVTAGELGDREPDLGTIEALGERMLAKVQAAQTAGGPGLSNLAQRLGGLDVDTRWDEYGRLSGRIFPNYGESVDELADRAARYGQAIDVYEVGQRIASGSPSRTDDTRYTVLLHRFASEQAAAAWLRGGVERAKLSPNIVTAAPVAAAATIGDASLTLATETARGGAGTARGYLIDAQVGAHVAQVQVLGLSGVPLSAIEELARSQVDCLRNHACPTRVAAPADLTRFSAGTPVASPAPLEREGAPTFCSPVVAAAATARPRLRTAETGNPSADEGATSPNIVFILTDDLDARSAACMPNVQSLLVKEGVTFANAFVTTPLCCPSRSSILRGQYAHNHGVLSNSGPAGGFPTFYRLGDEDSTVATWLHDAGYTTALFGKYLNRYPTGAAETHVPPGWDAWGVFASADGHDEAGSYFTDYTLNEDGTLVPYGRQPTDYSTDVLAAKATDFVEQAAVSGESFFLYVAPFAPHGPSTPASRHTGVLESAQAPRVPSFGEADVSDKPAWVRSIPALSDEQAALIDDRYRRRLRSLLAVDEMVASLIETLRVTGELDNTYIVFSSDNGFHLGEHRLPLGKSTAYDESIRVPLIVRGPGVPAGATFDQIVLNLDLAPTFAELAGAKAPGFVDGRSLAPLLRGETPAGWRRGFLVEHFSRVETEKENTPGPTPGAAIPEEAADEASESGISPANAPAYLALRTVLYLYVEYDDGERELYDVRTDPFALQNLASSADPTLIASLSAALGELRDCAQAGCRSAEDALP